MNENEISNKIIGAAIEVHKTLGGPGLLESIYEAALFHELQLQGMKVQRQIAVPVQYKGVVIKDPLYLDLLVENKVIVEVKALPDDHFIHQTQVLTYLRLTQLKLGLVINFGKVLLRDGIHRVANNYY